MIDDGGVVVHEVRFAHPVERVWSAIVDRAALAHWLIDDVATTVTITLRADGDDTLLRLEHTELPSDPRPRFDRGWVEKFDDLALLLSEASA